MSESKGKYGALLNKAKQAVKPETQEEVKPEIQEEVKPETHKEVKPEIQKKVKPEKMVNVGAKVPQSHRNHWAAEAKRSGRSMTDVIMSALVEAFGLPPEE